MNSIVFKVFVLVFSILILFFYLDFGEFSRYFVSVDASYISASFIFVILNQVLSTYRFKVVLSVFRVFISFSECHRVNIYSILSGLVFFNFFGQSISRSYLIRESANPESSFMVTALERVVSISLLLVAAVGSAIFVFGGVGFEYVANTPVLIGGLFVILCLTSVYFISFMPRQRKEIGLLLRDGWGARFWGVIAIVFLMHLCMLFAYLSLVIGMAGVDIISEHSLLASLLTMLGGALPISFGGWGAREVSASFAFKAASLPSELGVSAGIGVGLLTLIALGVNVFGVFLYRRLKNSKKLYGSSKDALSSDVFGKRLILILSWVSLPVIFVLMLVQFPIPLQSGHIALNIADPLAVVLGMTFMLVVIHRRAWGQIWRTGCIPYWLLAAFLVVLVGYIIGFNRIGFSEWALYNRLIGSGILFCYLVVGLVSVCFWGEFSVRSSTRALSTALVILAVLELSLRFVFNSDALSALGWNYSRWTGLLNNPNSYAFFLVSVFCLIFSFGGGISDLGKEWRKGVVPSLVLALIYLTLSRAALGAVLVLLIILLAFDWRRVVVSVVGGILIWFAIVSLNELFLQIVEETVGVSGFAGSRIDQFGDMQYDRVISLNEGWKMFLENPIFGAGLGVFHKSQVLKGTPLVIHNSFLWVLAEMGAFGFSIVFVPPLLWVSFIFFSGEWKFDPYRRTLMLIAFNAAIMGMAHELLYQRVFWLIMGMVFAAPFALRKKPANVAIGS